VATKIQYSAGQIALLVANFIAVFALGVLGFITGWKKTKILSFIVNKTVNSVV
jgi:hypothetical protein